MRRFRYGRAAAILLGVAFLLATDKTESHAEIQADTAAVTEAAEVRPEPTEYAHITSCVLDGNGQIVISGEMQGTWSDPAWYDNYLYLFELKPYQDTLDGRSDYLAWITKGDALNFTVPANLDTEDDRLYSRFAVAVYDGSAYHLVSNMAYITNPESIAKYTEAYRSAQNKKGLLIQTTDTMVTDAFELGVSHVIVNIPFQQLLGEGVDYVYHGKTYHFNKSLLTDCDIAIRRMSEKSMTVTAVILNGWVDHMPQLYYPGVTKREDAPYYGFNAATEEGYETLRAIATFLAERYGSMSSPYGKVSNWVIGNEVNNQAWNYTGDMGLSQYAKEFERAFRVFYTAIKSTSKNDRVFFSTDYCWNMVSGLGPYTYKAKDFIDTFAEQVRTGGDMDWGLAYHPYPLPMTEPEFWDDNIDGQVTQDVSSPIVNMNNLSVLTDYMQNDRLLQRDGSVRHIILTEQGFTSNSETRGSVPDIQAAAIAYAYYIIDSNRYIDAFILTRQVDALSETKKFMSFGLWYCDTSIENDIVASMKKKSWEVYKYIDVRSRTLETTEFAKSIIGISKWSDVIPNFKWKSLEK